MIKKWFLLAAFGCQFLVAQQIKFYNTFGHGIYDSGEGVWTSNDTGYVVGGITTPTGSNGTDMLIYKVDSIGTLQWYKNIGQDNSMEGAKSITCGKGKTEYILAGYQNNYDTSGYNFYVAKTDLNGDTLWTRIYGGSDWDMAYSVDTLQDSTYVIAGETYSYGNGNSDMYVIRINSNGDTLWTRTFGGADEDFARYVYTDRHDNIMVIGTTYSFGAGGSDVYIVLLNPMGDTIWTKTHGTSVDEFGYSGDMYIDNGGNMSYSFGFTWFNPVHQAQDGRLMRIDSTGTNVLTNIPVFASNPEIYDHIRMRKGAKGRFYHTGDIKYTPTGSTNMYMQFTAYGMIFNPLEEAFVTGSDYDWPKDIRKCFDKGYILTGETSTYGPGVSSTFVIKTDSLFNTNLTALVDIDDNNAITSLNFYPNPVSNFMFYVESNSPMELIRIYDLNGHVIESFMTPGSLTEIVKTDFIPSGLYVLEVTTIAGTVRKKMLVANQY